MLRQKYPLLLVADDNADMRRYLGRVLSRQYRIALAKDGAEALEQARTLRPDLILTDVVMPGESGRELAKRIAALVPAVPVLFTSGYTNGEIFRRGLLEPGASFVQKPLTPQALVRAVQQTLDGVGRPA